MGTRRLIPVVLLLAAFGCGMLAVACTPPDETGAPQTNAGNGSQTAPEIDQPAPAPQPEPLAIAAAALPAAVTGEAYTASIGLSRGARCEIASGGLPPGLTLDAAGKISGVPRVTGDWPVMLLATDGKDFVAASMTLTVTAAEGDPVLEKELRGVVATKRIRGLTSANVPKLNPAQVELGRLLFFDKELSGTRDVACATCHHPAFGYTDGLSLSVGVGGDKLGPGRKHPEGVLIARNSPPIYFSGLMPTMFWDRRVRRVRQGAARRSITPEGVMDLAPDEAQALFPLVDTWEMRGQGHDLDGLDEKEYRNALLERLKKYPEYVDGFKSAFGDGSTEDVITVENLGRAIAAFERSHTYVNAPWDRYLAGDAKALTDQQKRGANLFFGRAGCDNCHSGPLLTDFGIRNILVPQFGPGRGLGEERGEDFGAEDDLNNENARYTFRTPTLRNVTLTAPYMHNGAFNTLRETVLHYRDKAGSTLTFNIKQLAQAPDLSKPVTLSGDFFRRQDFQMLLVPDDLTDQEVDDIVAFLEALTDPQAVNRRQDIPDAVPSGLPVDK